MTKSGNRAVFQSAEQRDLERIFDTMSDWVALLDADGIIYRSNNKSEIFIGKSPKDILGQRCCVSLCHDQNQEANCPFARMKHSLKIEESEFRENNNNRWLQITVEPVKDSLGNLQGAVHIVRDITVKKLAEEKLQKNERLLKDAQSLGKIGSWEWDIKNGNLEWTDELYAIFGMKKSKLAPTFEQIVQIIHPEDRQFNQENVEKILKGKEKKIEFDFRIVTPKGQNKFIQQRIVIDRDTTGKAVHAVGTIQDVTKQAQIEQALRRSEQKLYTILNNAPLTLFATDDKGIFSLHEGKLLDKVGMKQGENVGKSAFDLFDKLRIAEHSGKQSTGSDVVRRVFSGEVVEGETRLGEVYFDNKFVPLKNDNNEIAGLVGIAFDITERKNTEAALRESEARFRSIFESAAIGIVTASPEARFLDVNPAFCKMTGYTKNELLNMSFFDITHPDDEDENLVQLEQVKAGIRKVIELKKRYIRKDEKIVWVQITSTWIFDNDSKPVYAVSLIQDITKLEENIKELNRSKNQLRKLSAHLENIREEERRNLSREIHDQMGQTLTGLNMDLHWIEKRIRSEAKDGSSDFTLKKIAEMVNTVNLTIKTVRRVSSEMRPAMLDDLGLSATIDWQVKEFTERSGIRCLFESKPENIRLHKQQNSHIFRICQEALTNIARHAEATLVIIKIRLSNNKFTLSITDNGRGISPEEIKSTRSLGILGITERVYFLNGKFKINGIPGKGTQIEIEIPIDIVN